MTEEIYAAEQGTQEISEPETEAIEEVNDVEEPEVTEQASEGLPEGKSKQDAAFAELRRERDELRRRAEEAEAWRAETEARQSARNRGIAKVTGDDGSDLSAIAESYGVTVEELEEAIAEVEAEEAEKAEQQKILNERDHYKELYEQSEIRARSEGDIARIKKAFPEEAKDINTFDDLARTCGHYMNADKNMTPEEAFGTYLTVKARTERKPPKEIGPVGQTPDENGFLSREQVDAMSEEEQKANFELILKSQRRW